MTSHFTYVENIVEALRDCHGTILDIGCGEGNLLSSLPDDFSFKVGVDIVGSAMDVLADAHWLPFKDKSFDIVVLNHVLEHVDCPIKVLIEAKRVCKKSLLIQVPNVKQSVVFNDACSDVPHPHIYSWTKETFLQLLTKAFPENNIEINLIGKPRELPDLPFPVLRRTLNYFINYLYLKTFDEPTNIFVRIDMYD